MSDLGLYILDKDRKPVKVDSVLEWGRFFESHDRIVAQWDFGDVHVSTVFIGIDHSWFGGPPVLFETMVFGGKLDRLRRMYSTWAEAEAGHMRMCKIVRRLERARAKT